jgi:hypothetical protein
MKEKKRKLCCESKFGSEGREKKRKAKLRVNDACIEQQADEIVIRSCLHQELPCRLNADTTGTDDELRPLTLALSLSVAPPRKSEGVPPLLAPGSWPADVVCISHRCKSPSSPLHRRSLKLPRPPSIWVWRRRSMAGKFMPTSLHKPQHVATTPYHSSIR